MLTAILPVREVAQEIRTVRQLNTSAMVAEIAVLNSADETRNKKDADARAQRMQDMAAVMMRHLRTLADFEGVEVPEVIGGSGGWLSALRHNHPVLHARWQQYRMDVEKACGWQSSTPFKDIFRWAHDYEGAQATLSSSRETVKQSNTRKSALSITKLRDILNKAGDAELLRYVKEQIQ